MYKKGNETKTTKITELDRHIKKTVDLSSAKQVNLGK